MLGPVRVQPETKLLGRWIIASCLTCASEQEKLMPIEYTPWINVISVTAFAGSSNDQVFSGMSQKWWFWSLLWGPSARSSMRENEPGTGTSWDKRYAQFMQLALACHKNPWATPRHQNLYSMVLWGIGSTKSTRSKLAPLELTRANAQKFFRRHKGQQVRFGQVLLFRVFFAFVFLPQDLLEIKGVGTLVSAKSTVNMT